MNSSPDVCPRCRHALPTAAAEGLCPACLFAALMEEPADEDAAVQRFGDFEIVEPIGRGGAGAVYRARQRGLNRTVALKVISAADAEAPDFLERFRIEAEAVASLEHPNIVSVHGFGEHEGQYFLAMRFVPGGSLVRRERMEPQAAAKLVATVARAVHYAHQRGILHRDIKPGNILLDEAGEPHLADFGLAKLIGRDSAITRTAAVMGTPSYMSPEQAAGRTREITTAADVYGLGAVLYDLLTGAPPFAGATTLETIRAVQEDDPVRPSARGAAVDRDLETICLKCLEKDPARRYGSADALADDLERWLRHEPIAARPIGAVERMGRWVRRHRMRAALIATALLAVLTVAVVSSWMNVRLVRARGTIDTQNETRRRELVALHLSTGQRLAEEGETFAALESFAEAARLDAADAARMEMHRLRFAVTLANAPQLEQQLAHPDVVRTVAFDGDGRRIVTACVDGLARVWDASTGGLALPPIVAAGPLRWAGFSPDGALVATRTEAGEVRLHRSDTGALAAGPWPARALTAAEHSLPRELAFSAQGRWLAIPGQSEVTVQDLRDASGTARIFPVARPVNQLFFSPDETLLAVLTEARTIELREVETGRKIEAPGGFTTPRQRAWRSGAWSPDGTRIALTDDWQFAYIFDARSGRQLSPELAHVGYIYGCRFRPDGRALLTWGKDNTARLWDAEDGHSLAAPLRHRGPVWVALFSGNGRRLATASSDDSVRLWDGITGERLGSRLPHGSPVRDVAFSPDGERVLAAGIDGCVRLWKVPAAGFARWTWPQQSAVNSVVFGPDARLVAAIGIEDAAQVWDSATGQPASPVLRHPKRAYDIAWLDAGRLATTCDDLQFRVWEIPSGRLLSTAPMPADERGKFNGTRYLAWPPGDAPGLWEPEHGQREATFAAADDEKVAPTNDGREFVAWRDRTVRIATASGTDTAPPPFVLESKVAFARLDPARRRIAVGYFGSTTDILDRTTGARIAGPLRHIAQVRHLAFTPDSRVLATSSDDGTLRLWDTATGEPLGPPFLHPDRVIRTALRPDGRALATACSDGFTRFWEIPPAPQTPDEMMRVARRLNGRGE